MPVVCGITLNIIPQTNRYFNSEFVNIFGASPPPCVPFRARAKRRADRRRRSARSPKRTGGNAARQARHCPTGRKPHPWRRSPAGAPTPTVSRNAVTVRVGHTLPMKRVNVPPFSPPLRTDTHTTRKNNLSTEAVRRRRRGAFYIDKFIKNQTKRSVFI